MITSSVLGSFLKDQKTREEFFSIVNKAKWLSVSSLR
jgi:GTP cyclohydrolase I